MRTYAYIQSGVVHEVIVPALWESDSSIFAPEENLDEDGSVVGHTHQPVDWPVHKAGDEIPLAQRYAAEFVAECIDITGMDPQPVQGWLYSSGVFSAPTLPAPAMAERIAMRDSLLSAATLRIAPLQDAVDLEMATSDDVSRLKAWKTYRVQVSRTDLSTYPIDWPAQPS